MFARENDTISYYHPLAPPPTGMPLVTLIPNSICCNNVLINNEWACNIPFVFEIKDPLDASAVLVFSSTIYRNVTNGALALAKVGDTCTVTHTTGVTSIGTITTGSANVI